MRGRIAAGKAKPKTKTQEQEEKEIEFKKEKEKEVRMLFYLEPKTTYKSWKKKTTRNPSRNSNYWKGY